MKRSAKSKTNAAYRPRGMEYATDGTAFFAAKRMIRSDRIAFTTVEHRQ